MKEIVESECVMLYHLSETVKKYSSAATQILKSAKMSASAPHLWLQPFLLASLLTLSNIPPNGSLVRPLLRVLAWISSRKLASLVGVSIRDSKSTTDSFFALTGRKSAV